MRGKRESSEFRSVINDSPTIIPKVLNESSINSTVVGLLRIDGYRIESSDRQPSYSDDGIPEFRIGTSVTIRIFGSGITEKTIITFTEESHLRGGSCLIPATGQFSVIKGSVYGDSIALVNFKVPIAKSYLYMCARYAESDTSMVSVFYKYIMYTVVMICLLYNILFISFNTKNILS